MKDKKSFYNIISNVQGVLNLGRMRNLTLVVFKTLAISKIVSLALLIKILRHVVKELEKM